MLKKLISGAAVFIISGIGLFFNSADVEEDSSNLSMTRNILVAVSIAAVVVSVRFIMKSINGAERLERKSHFVRKSRKKELKQKKALQSEKVRKLESFDIGEEQYQLRGDKLNFRGNAIEMQEVMDQNAFIDSGEWVSVEKKVKKKSQHSAQSRIVSFSTNKYITKENNAVDVVKRDFKNVSYVKKESSVLKDVVKSQYLRQGARPKNNTVFNQNVNSLGKISSELPVMTNRKDCAANEKLSTNAREQNYLNSQYLEHKDSSSNASFVPPINYREKLSIVPDSDMESMSLVNSQNSTAGIISKNPKHSPCVAFDRRSAFVGVSGNEYYNMLKSHSVSSGLFFKGKQYDVRSVEYKKITDEFCKKVYKFRQLHFTYCIKLMHRIFKVRGSKLVVSESVNIMFAQLTKHKEILFFILKIFFLMNLSVLCGGKSIIYNLRYCSRYFYDQSLLDLIISEVIMCVSKEDSVFSGIKIKGIFESYSAHLHDVSVYIPYSGDFFRQVFDLCCNLASVKLSQKDQELIDFVMLGCMVYCGNMVTMSYRMLIYNNEAKCGDNLESHFKAYRFCRQCYNLKLTMVHMYHPTCEDERTNTVGGIIDVPIRLWRTCSKDIDDAIIKSNNQGKIKFSIFVNDMIRVAKKLILSRYVRYLYRKDIDMYENKLKTARSLLPFPLSKITFTQKENENSKSL